MLVRRALRGRAQARLARPPRHAIRRGQPPLVVLVCGHSSALFVTRGQNAFSRAVRPPLCKRSQPAGSRSRGLARRGCLARQQLPRPPQGRGRRAGLSGAQLWSGHRPKRTAPDLVGPGPSLASAAAKARKRNPAPNAFDTNYYRRLNAQSLNAAAGPALCGSREPGMRRRAAPRRWLPASRGTRLPRTTCRAGRKCPWRQRRPTTWNSRRSTTARPVSVAVASRMPSRKRSLRR